MNENTKTVFETLSKIDVKGMTEKKNGLTYLSWAFAWGALKKAFPCAFYTIYENKDGLNYHHDGKTAWVKTGVTVEGLELIEFLPVMDFRNKSISVDKISSFDVNKAIQRSLTKAVARHGLGLSVYAGEDIPENVEQVPQKTDPKQDIENIRARIIDLFVEIEPRVPNSAKVSNDINNAKEVEMLLAIETFLKGIK